MTEAYFVLAIGNGLQDRLAAKIKPPIRVPNPDAPVSSMVWVAALKVKMAAFLVINCKPSAPEVTSRWYVPRQKEDAG